MPFMAPRPRPRTSRLIVLLLSVAIATGLATTVVSADALPPCRVADVTTSNRSYTDWTRTILDTTYRLTSAYEPSDLRSTADAGLNGGQRAARSRVVVPELFEPGLDLRVLGARVRLRRGPAIEREGGSQRASARD